MKVTKTSVPDLRGASLEVARNGLESRGLTVGLVSYQYSAQAAGTVISQTPSGGTELYSGESVDLVISDRDSATDYNETSYAESSYEEPRTNEEPSEYRNESVYYDESEERSVEAETYASEPTESVIFDAPSREDGGTKSR